MVDTLAPKKIFTQRDLDSSLSSSNKVNTTNGSATSMVESLPKKAIVKPLINIQQPDYLIDADTVLTQMVEKSAPSTTEREQTIQSSNELTDVKQTGSQVKKDVAQGLGSNPIAYAEEGFENKVIDRPVVVGEGGMEMIVPTGKNKFTVVNNEALQGLMTKINMTDEQRRLNKFSAPYGNPADEDGIITNDEQMGIRFDEVSKIKDYFGSRGDKIPESFKNYTTEGRGSDPLFDSILEMNDEELAPRVKEKKDNFEFQTNPNNDSIMAPTPVYLDQDSGYYKPFGTDKGPDYYPTGMEPFFDAMTPKFLDNLYQKGRELFGSESEYEEFKRIMDETNFPEDSEV